MLYLFIMQLYFFNFCWQVLFIIILHYIWFEILHCISNVLSKVKRRMHAHFSERLVNYCQIAQSLAKNQSAPRYTNVKVVYVLGEILHFTSGKHKIAKKVAHRIHVLWRKLQLSDWKVAFDLGWFILQKSFTDMHFC